MNRTCKTCGGNKPLEDFPEWKTGKWSGRRHVCKACSQKTGTNTEALLISACRIIDMYWPEAMSVELAAWWEPKKESIRRRKAEESDAGLADAALSQIITDESELVSDCC